VSDAAVARLVRSGVEAADKAVTDRVQELAEKKGVPMATVAIAWCLSKQSVNPIVGLSSIERINQAVDAVKFASEGGLTAEDIKYLEEPYVSRAPVN